MFRLAFLPVVITLALAGCSPAPQVPVDVAAPSEPAAPAPAVLGSGIEQRNFDTAVAPGDDFYRYVNGAWLRNTQIPADKSAYGAGSELSDTAEANLRSIIEGAAAENAPAGSDSQKAGDYYAAFMDVANLEALGSTPIQPTLAQIAAVAGKDDLLVLTADLNRIGVQIPTGIYIGNDEKQSDQYITYITQSGLGLPDRDWYLGSDDETHRQARTAYSTYITRALTLAGYERAATAATSVLEIETRIAQAHWDRVQDRQAELTYTKMTLDNLRSAAPGINWQPLLEGLGVSETSFVVRQPSFVQTFAQIWQQVPLQQWQDYYSFKTVDAFAGYLSDAFVQAQFDFEGRVLGGQSEQEARWKRGVGAVDRALGEVLGKLYVDKYFQQESKQRMDQLVENLRAAFKSGINELAWMTPETKTAAQEKLAKFNTKIGYPNSWKDYSALTVEPGDLMGNVMRSRRMEHQREVDKLGTPINRDEWLMNTFVVNAYYYPPMNEVVFPAAILQPPFFNVAANDAVNYGSIGAIIGHEFSHGFDDQGRKYDGDGNLRDWWTDADAAAFTENAGKLVAQYNQFEVLPGKFLNGEFTLGENIGDLSGLAVAYRAYKMSLNGQQDAVIDGFTGDQRFFIGYAHSWRELYRPELLEVLLTADPHSPNEARTNIVLRNFDPWYQAFNVQSGSKLYLAPEERVRIW